MYRDCEPLKEDEAFELYDKLTVQEEAIILPKNKAAEFVSYIIGVLLDDVIEDEVIPDGFGEDVEYLVDCIHQINKSSNSNWEFKKFPMAQLELSIKEL